MSEIIDINVYETTEDVTINVTEEVIEVNINQVSSGSIGAWGSIIGDIADQTDLQNALDLKVDKVAGKELSENDFTDILKTKLDGIEAGAEVNVNADWNSVSGDSEILNKPTIPSIEGLATVTYVDSQDDLKENDLGNPLVDGYVLASTIAGVRSWVEKGSVGGGTWGSITGTLSDQTDLQSALDNKVDKVVGKELSTNDFTDALETKLNGIEAGAEVNVNADWNAISGDAQILNKPAIPTNTSDLTNDGEDGVNPFITALDLTGLVPYIGATQDVNLGEFGLQTGNIEFDLTPTAAPTTVGSMVWNDQAGTVDLKLKGGNVTLQIGQETVIRVVNKTATNITLLEANYQAVRVTGAQGQRPKVDLALADNDLNSTTTIGLVTETILDNQEGFITTSGQVQGVNTTGSLQGETWADGDMLYLSGTVAGQITNIKPIAPVHTIIIGFVEYAHITQGKIFVKVDNGYELEELHNVSAIAPNNNEVLTYDTSSLLWKPKTVSTALGYTPENQANKEDVVLDTSAIKYPTNNLVKTNIDLKANIASPTFTGTVTTPAIIVSSETINTIASFDASKNIKSLPTVTYPDLTELSYVKGTTSAIQTQLNEKQATLTNPITGTGTTNFISKFTGSTALGNSLLTDNGTNVGIGINPAVYTFQVQKNGAACIAASTSNTQALFRAEVGVVAVDLNTSGTVGELRTATNHALILSTNSTERVRIEATGGVTCTSTLRASNIGIGAAANLASYLNVIANTASVGQLYLPPSAVDYTGTLSGMLWNNTSEWKFYDGVLSSVNRLIKLNGNSILANANPLNVVTSTGTGGNLGTLKAEVSFSRYPTAVSYTVLLTDVGFGWVVAVTDTSAARTINLPVANTVPAGWQTTIKDESGGALLNAITVSRSSTDTIEGATSRAINTNYGVLKLYSDGVSKWFII